ncbi:GNAT family N-acetyltransferase [Corynebacterium cystitidis]|uniref:Protein N-acetyltransferase, RimJ/RimL family n=1 Tax=Corynebacterium cystitidis DSM 20524 TaxID=1121357 RepID=A0A1H9S606_9CORY|nr:GNAT family protein [Corynebacterium cystitidis]WJY82214.1 hypothetical protein CCYS_06405 [Corynebacterium cystitidis DSM 20524]SER80055.1 Protein N-acetyltransferase, RimJ/RimL family [Corynebacterium cystitidis DSM 20524]SNV77746.1 acetyltransferase [Corynebacterium cystitidis]
MTGEYATPVPLANEHVRLEPLGHEHAPDLAHAVGDLWETWYTHIPHPEQMAAEIDARLDKQSRGEIAAWAIVDTHGYAVGMTTYLHLDPDNRRLEIGSTWLGRDAQGTVVNPASKLLLLQRAFETLGCLGVEFRCHWHNRQSRRAIEALGAKLDGVLRKHTVFENGTVRDTCVYSVLDDEWPTVKLGLTERLRHARSRRAARDS